MKILNGVNLTFYKMLVQFYRTRNFTKSIIVMADDFSVYETVAPKVMRQKCVSNDGFITYCLLSRRKVKESLKGKIFI